MPVKLMSFVRLLQVEPVGYPDRPAVNHRNRPGGDENKRHSNQPHHHPSHEGA